MWDWYKYDMIKPINKNSKIIIGLGDSFTEGHGACTNELWEKCNWNLDKLPEGTAMDYQRSFYENSWVHKLCKNHLTDHIPINLGMTGRGNRGAVKELYLHPELKMETAREKIVVFMLSGYERFDFVHKEFNQHIHYQTMWPQCTTKIKQKNLWLAYGEHVYSDRVAIIEMLLGIAEVKMWCKANNAKLILTSAFRPDYRRNILYERILNDCECNDGKTPNYLQKQVDYVNRMVNIIDWDDFLRPNGYYCFADYLLHIEGRDDMINNTDQSLFYQFGQSLEKLSPNGYITNCSHPSQKGHEEMAKVIYNHIIKIKDKPKEKLF
jgi:hypothetical protein